MQHADVPPTPISGGSAFPAMEGGPKRIISSTRNDGSPGYSWDGRKIGSNPLQITWFGKGWSGSPSWSPDGESIAFDRLDNDRLADEKWDIYVVKSQGGAPVRLTSNSNAIRPRWSADGKWVYYTSDRTGRYEAWKVSSAGGPEVQFTRNGGFMPRASTDGREVYYKKPPSADPTLGLWKMPVNGGDESKVVEGVTGFQLTGGGIYYSRVSGTSSGFVRFLDFAKGHARSIAMPSRAGVFCVSPDERWMVYAQQDGTLKDLMLVENFQ